MRINVSSDDGGLVLGRVQVSASQTPLLQLPENERFFHTHVLGRPGSGKSTLLLNLIMQDIEQGRGCAVIDPHGELAEKILAHFPAGRLNDLVVLDPSDPDYVCSFNPLFNVPPALHGLVVSNVIELFRSIWPDGFGARMEDIFRNALFVLLEQPASHGVSLASVIRLLQDHRYRHSALRHVTNTEVKRFFELDFNRQTARDQTQICSPVLNKLRAFLSDPAMRDMFALARPTLDIARALDSGRIIIANLALGKIGSNNARLLGSFLLSTLRFAAQARAQHPNAEFDGFHIYVDELQNFVTMDFIRAFPEVRKHKLSYVVAHQHRTQLPPAIVETIKETSGTMVAFSLGIEDAQFYAPMFQPVSPHLLSSQDIGNAYVRHATRSGKINQLKIEDAQRRLTNCRDKALRISREHFYLPRKKARDTIARSERRHSEKYRPKLRSHH